MGPAREERDERDGNRPVGTSTKGSSELCQLKTSRDAGAHIDVEVAAEGFVLQFAHRLSDTFEVPLCRSIHVRKLR